MSELQSRTIREDHPEGFRELGVITFQGKEFASGGAYVDDHHLVCYPDAPTSHSVLNGGYYGLAPNAGLIKTWGGNTIGRYVITGRASGFRDVTGRRTPLICYRVTLDDGRVYVGRGLGHGMILKARRSTARKGR